MRSFLPLAALLATTLAAPILSRIPDKYYLPLTVTLFNDVTGAHAAAGIDTSAHSFNFWWDLFRGTAVDRDGRIIGTGIQLSFPDLPLPTGYGCGVYSGDKTIGTLDAMHTYLDLDGRPAEAVETDVTDFVVKCDGYIVGQS